MDASKTTVFPDKYFGTVNGTGPSGEDVARMRKGYKKYLISFIESLPHEAHILDLGCGKGKAIRLIRAIRPDLHITATDITNMRAWLPEEVQFIQSPLETLSSQIPAASFDAIVCQHVIEHLLYPLELMQTIHFALRSEGTCYLETPNWTRMIVPFSSIYFWNDYTHIRPFSRAAFHRLFDEHGFTIQKIVTTSSNTWFPQKNYQPAHKDESNLLPQLAHTVSDRGNIARIASRVINPLLRDVLIGIAKK